MNTILRMTEYFWNQIHHDLSRPHLFATERVGFIACRMGKLREGVVLLADKYLTIDDEDYIDNPKVGAMIGASAIRKALQFAFNNPVCMFHVHRHEHSGKPFFSRVDLCGSAKLIPDFWKVQQHNFHGALVLSLDSALGLIWEPKSKLVQPLDEFIVVGRPINHVRFNDE